MQSRKHSWADFGGLIVYKYVLTEGCVPGCLHVCGSLSGCRALMMQAPQRQQQPCNYVPANQSESQNLRYFQREQSWCAPPRTSLCIPCSLSLKSPIAAAQEIDEGDTSQKHHHFVATALQPLVALLLEQLVKQDENQVSFCKLWHCLPGRCSVCTIFTCDFRWLHVSLFISSFILSVLGWHLMYQGAAVACLQSTGTSWQNV